MAVEHHIRKTPVDRLLSVQLGAFDQQAEGAMKIALRTSQLVAYETRATNVVDPLGGSYYVESLTDELEKKAWGSDQDDRVARRNAALRVHWRWCARPRAKART